MIVVRPEREWPCWFRSCTRHRRGTARACCPQQERECLCHAATHAPTHAAASRPKREGPRWFHSCARQPSKAPSSAPPRQRQPPKLLKESSLMRPMDASSLVSFPPSLFMELSGPPPPPLWPLRRGSSSRAAQAEGRHGQRPGDGRTEALMHFPLFLSLLSSSSSTFLHLPLSLSLSVSLPPAASERKAAMGWKPGSGGGNLHPFAPWARLHRTNVYLPVKAAWRPERPGGRWNSWP